MYVLERCNVCVKREIGRRKGVRRVREFARELMILDECVRGREMRIDEREIKESLSFRKAET